MDEKTIRDAKCAAEMAVASAIRYGQRVEIVPLKDGIKVNIVERKEIKLAPQGETPI